MNPKNLKVSFMNSQPIHEESLVRYYPYHLWKEIYQKSIIAMESLEKKQCPGNHFTGWLDLPEQNIHRYLEIAQHLSHYDTIVSIGIGGSYLGIRAIQEALKTPFEKSKKEIIYAGHNLSSKYLKSLLNYLESKNFALIVISKSGTTTEPAIAFRFLFRTLIKKFGEQEISKRVIVITDKEKGTLRQLAKKFQLPSDVVPDDVGGRYSVLSAVGLIPLASIGIDIQKIILGAYTIMEVIRNQKHIENNPALAYAVYRNLNYATKKNIELLATYRPELFYFLEWWKQLFGESEGKEYKGIYPTSSIFTTDLHSLGQWVQQGERNIFETLIDIYEDEELTLFTQEDDSDGLNYLSGKSLNQINRIALKATREAHISGGVPAFTFEIPILDEFTIGELIYTFEYACAISALITGVNPFDQPGVEAYKSNMFRLLKKPGYV